MFERFTDRARRVIVLAQDDARTLGHDHIGTAHILLGLVHEGEGVAARALDSLGIALDDVRQQVEKVIGRGEQSPSGHLPFTPQAKKVVELSLREALLLGHNYIGTEHILLGLIREGEGVAGEILTGMGADLNRVRRRTLQVLAGQIRERRAAETGVPRAKVYRVAWGPSAIPPVIPQWRFVVTVPRTYERVTGICETWDCAMRQAQAVLREARAC